MEAIILFTLQLRKLRLGERLTTLPKATELNSCMLFLHSSSKDVL